MEGIENTWVQTESMADLVSDNTSPEIGLQELQEKAKKYEESWIREEKMRKELEELNTKLLQEKTDLLKHLDGEKGALSEYQEKALKLGAQKADLESQLSVSQKL